jgi:hypothetical protein
LPAVYRRLRASPLNVKTRLCSVFFDDMDLIDTIARLV